MFETIEINAKDIETRMAERTLLQFRRSPVFLALLSALGSQIQLLVDATDQVVKMRGGADAVGVNLEGLGRIVGQMRELIGYESEIWFAPDREEVFTDDAPVWVKNAPLASNLMSDDIMFRQLIEAKVLRNHVKYGSVPELQAFMSKAFNLDISFMRIDTMTVDVIVPDSTSDNIVALLEREFSTKIAEGFYLLPLAACVKISSVKRLSDVS